MISLNNLTMILGHKLLLHEVDLFINSRGRYGLVGSNGSGKSTFFKLLAKELAPADGTIAISKDLKIGWLNQDHFKFDDELLINIVIRGNAKLWEAMEAKEAIFKEEEFTEAHGLQLGHLEEIIAHENGYQAESDAESLLLGLGVDQKFHYETLSSLSGGYKMRVLMAQTLFDNPDILLLDEPTNHLDIMTTVWLENYLIKKYKGILITISHDRDFLNHLSTHILDIDYGDIRIYHGNYDKFTQQKAEIVEQKKKLRASGAKKISEMKEFVDRFRAKASKAKQAQSRLKMIDKIELPENEISSRIHPRINFQLTCPSGKQALKVEKLTKTFGDDCLYKDISFNIRRGEKVAIIGRNGVGKSTMIKQLLGELDEEGSIFEWGHETKISYFSQDHHDLLKENITVYEWLRNLPLKLTEVDIRKTLGQVLFKKEDVHKNLLSLSGGEAARILIAKIMLEKSNVLIFDEPTNHIDIESIDALTEALCLFKGTLILVSHNRYFVSKIADRIFAMTEQGLTDHIGTYDEFIARYGDDYLSGKWLNSNITV